MAGHVIFIDFCWFAALVRLSRPPTRLGTSPCGYQVVSLDPVWVSRTQFPLGVSVPDGAGALETGCHVVRLIGQSRAAGPRGCGLSWTFGRLPCMDLTPCHPSWEAMEIVQVSWCIMGCHTEELIRIFHMQFTGVKRSIFDDHGAEGTPRSTCEGQDWDEPQCRGHDAGQAK